MRHFAITGMETAAMISRIFLGDAMRATPPSARICAGTRSRAITETAPAFSAITACSALVTSIMTPPLSISARPVFKRKLVGLPLFCDMFSYSFQVVLCRIARMRERARRVHISRFILQPPPTSVLVAFLTAKSKALPQRALRCGSGASADGCDHCSAFRRPVHLFYASHYEHPGEDTG